MTTLSAVPRPSTSSSDSGEELIPVRKRPIQRLPRRLNARACPDDYDPHPLQVYDDLDFLGRLQRKKSESPPRFPEAAQTLPTPLLIENTPREHPRPETKTTLPPFLISPDPLKDTIPVRSLPAANVLKSPMVTTQSQPRLKTNRESDIWVRHGSAEMRLRPKKERVESLPESQKNSRVLDSLSPPQARVRKRRVIKKKLAPLAINKVGDLMGAYLGTARSARLLKTAAGGRFRP